MMTQTLTPEQVTALGIARTMAAAGIPIFIAQPDTAAKTGFRPPRNWEKTVPDPGVVDQWRPGLALCAVMGCGFDLADIDPRNGGDVAALNGSTPRIYGVAATPSGGTHLFIASLRTGSRDNVYPGIDIKGGQPDGSGRGFAFLAPTVRASVVTGEPSAYRWLQIPDLTTLDPTDESGAALANRIRNLRASSGGMRSVGGPDWWRSFLASREPQAAPAAERAIADKLAEVSSWNTQSGGGFRTVLLRAALTLGGYVGGGYLDEYEARQRLEAAVEAVWGSPDPDDLLWIQQGLDDGAVQPFHVFTEADARQHSDVAQAVAGESEVPRVGDGGGPVPPWSVFSVLHSHFDPAGDGSDQGLAKAVAYQMYPALRYATDSGLWIKRGEMVWEEASDDLSDWIISIMAELMPLGSTPVPKEATDRTEQHWQAVRRAQFMSSAGAGKIARKLRAIIRSDHPASLRSAALDTNPEVLWAGGVPWDLRASGEVPTPASWIDPNTPHLRTALCAPDPTVPTPRWDAFLAVVLPDPELRAWALRVLSIALTGYPDAACPILYGRERSGKSSLVEMLVTVLGSYAHAANPKLLSAQDNSHDTIVYDLKGRRLSFIDEGPKRGHEATERLKQLTGGASLTARAMRANPVTFAPTHTLVMTTNNEPHLTDPALRARMRLIPCDADEAIVRPARLPLLGQGLVAEAPGILAAMMRETAAYLADRDSASTTAAPASIRGLAQEMAEGQDPVREWVDNCTVPADPGTPSRALYTSFARWHQDSPLYRRMSVPSETAFGRTLTEMGHAAAKVAGHRYRPLSVLSGPAGVAPWEPMPAEHMTRGTALPTAEPPAKSDAGTPVGGLLGGLKTDPPAEPANPENPSSTPIFSSSLAGMAGYYPLHTTEKDTDRYRENTEEKAPQPATPPSSGEKTAADLQKPSNPEGLGGTRQRSSSEIDQQAGPPTEDPSRSVIYKEDRDGLSAAEIKAGLDAQRELGLPLTDTQERDLEEARKQEARVATRERNVEVARRAAEAGISKAEVRAQLKAEQRAAAIREAAGEVLSLPAVVDRLGNVLPLTLEQARDVVRAAVTRSGALTVDVETSGYPVGHADYELRSVQLGDETAAVVFHPVDHADEIQAQLGAAPALHAHSATADLVPLTHAGLVDADAAWARMHDTVIPAKLADPASTGSDPGLKQLAGAVLGESSVAPAAEAARAALFKAGKWLEKTKVDTPVERSGWAQVETGSTTMLRYAASDVLDTAALARVLPRPASAVYERERIAQLMTARVTHRGVRLDREQIAALTERHTAGRADAASRVRAFGVDNPGSDQQVGQAATALGADLPKTATGRPSVAVGVLEPLKDAPGAIGELVSAVLDYRHHDTALGLFLAPYRLLCERGDGRARPTIYTLGTDTGRMCLPVDHGLVTPAGHVKSEDVAPGMVTLDAEGNWVRVLAVHRYDDAPIETLSNRGIEIAGTPEHRWVTTREHEAAYAARTGRPAPARQLRRLSDHPRLRVHLAPDVEPFDLDARTIPAETDGQRFAALVGMLVTDGRCVDSDEPEVGMRAHVYQTEAKFHAEFRRVIPEEAVMYDRVTTSGEAHHEIRIAARWLRPRLDAAGLRTGAKLKDSPDLHVWVAGLPLDEVRAFLAACWLSDGSLERGDLSCGSGNLRAVLTLAAYRLGMIAYAYESPPSEWSNGPRSALSFRRPVITVRKSEHGTGRSDVWCVTTETGTFTAVGPRGTVYLTGNSAVRPNLQQLPREGGVRACITADPGQLMISADFSGVEIRVAAALSQDATLLRFLQDDRDLHWEVARMVYGPDATKAHRYRVKRGVFGRLYGGGVPTLAMQMGVPESVARKTVEALDALTPQLSAWSHSIREAVKHGQTQFSSYSGRVIHLPREFPHKGPNYCLALDTPILRSDLEHVAASKVQVGDRLVGFDEYPLDGVGGTNKYHHMRTAVVEATSVIVKPSVRVHTADGKTTECSADHLWLARPLKGRKNNRPRVRWVRADQLQPGDDLLSLGTWDVAEGRTAGYLAGLYDGEGSLQCRGEGSGATGLHFSQLPGPVMDAFCAGMVDLGLPHAYYKRPPNSTSPTDSVVVAGIRNIMRVLGTLQPRRFRHRLEGVYEGAAITAGLTNPVVVTAVEPAGDLELASIQTSTRTLIANGYLSHNCIQGTARELLVDALVKWRDTQWGACTLLPVHDELDVFVPAQDAEAATRELVRCMEVNLFGVKIIAEPSKPAFAWADSA